MALAPSHRATIQAPVCPILLMTHRSGLLLAANRVIDHACVFLNAGPRLLDLGDILYAPTTFRDASGRLLMVAWLQELREGGGFDYAGSLSVSHLMHLTGEGPPCECHFLMRRDPLCTMV